MGLKMVLMQFQLQKTIQSASFIAYIFSFYEPSKMLLLCCSRLLIFSPAYYSYRYFLCQQGAKL